MDNVTELAQALSFTHLGGIMEGCVIKVKDNKATILCMDKAATLMVNATAEVGIPNGDIGIGNLAKFLKYMNSIKDRPVIIKFKDNKLVIKPSVGSLVSHLLVEIDFIPNFDSDWDDDVIEKELDNFEGSLELDEIDIKELVSSMNMWEPNSITFTVTPKGKVIVTGGPESGTNFRLPIGTSDIPQCSLQLLSKNIASVLSCLTFVEKPIMYLSQEDGVIVTNAGTSWILQPIADSDFMDAEDGDEPEL